MQVTQAALLTDVTGRLAYLRRLSNAAQAGYQVTQNQR